MNFSERAKILAGLGCVDYIVEFENILSDDVCDQILKEYKNSNDWGPTFVGGGVVDRNIRNVDSIK